jgi:Domain of unknown function (DUF4412)
MMCAALFLVLSSPAPPGLYYEQTTRTATEGETPGPAVRTRVYSLGRRMRLESAETPAGTALVLLLDEGRAFRLDPARKTVTLIDADRLRAQSQLDLAVAGEALGAADQATVRTAPLAATRTVAGHSCRGYRITGPQSRLDLYVADLGPGLGVDTFASFLEWSGASQSLGPLLDALRRLPGFPLEASVRATMAGRDVATTTTVTRITVGPLAPSLFEIPAGYQVLEPASLPEE